MKMRGGSGLGDSVYLRPVAEYFVRLGKSVTVRSDYPDIFIGSGATTEPFCKFPAVDIIAHYHGNRRNQKSTQFADMLKCAGITEDVPLRFTWNIRNHALIDDLTARATGRPVVVVHGGRAPFGRSDGVGAELLPKRESFEAVIAMFADCFTVRVGKGKQIYALPCSYDLSDKTSVSDLLDIVSTCDATVTQCGYPVPMAECFGKPVLAIWASRGLHSVRPIIPSVTPAKILSAPTSHYVVDEWQTSRMQDAALTFRRETMEVEQAAA
jgi:hypothetical protein